MNKVILFGRLGQDPELRYTESGTAVGNFSLATSEKYRDKDGNIVDNTEWHRVTVWGSQAETIKEYCKKGQQLLVEGKIKTQKWEDKEGNTRYSTGIVLSRFSFVGGQNTDNNGPNEEIPEPTKEESTKEDDLPF